MGRNFLASITDWYSHYQICQKSLTGFFKKVSSTAKGGAELLRNRNRAIQVKFYVNEKELNQINNRYRLANVTNKGAYFRKMALDGYIVNVDTTDLKAAVKKMNAIGKNINQITRNANTYGIMEQDIKAIQSMVDEIWQLLKSTLSSALSANQ